MLVEEIKKNPDFGGNFAAVGAGGGGASQQGKGTGGGINVIKKAVGKAPAKAWVEQATRGSASR